MTLTLIENRYCVSFYNEWIVASFITAQEAFEWAEDVAPGEIVEVNINPQNLNLQ